MKGRTFIDKTAAPPPQDPVPSQIPALTYAYNNSAQAYLRFPKQAICKCLKWPDGGFTPHPCTLAGGPGGRQAIEGRSKGFVGGDGYKAGCCDSGIRCAQKDTREQNERRESVGMKRIRVLEVGNKLGGLGGTEKTVELFVRYLDRSEFEPAVFSNGGFEGPRTHLFDALDVPLYCEPEKTGTGPSRGLAGDSASFLDLGDVIDEFRPHVVHVHRAGHSEPYVIETAHGHGVPIILETNVFGRQDASPAERLIDCHLFVSYFCMRRYQECVRHPLVSDRYKVLYNPIDLKGFMENEDSPRGQSPFSREGDHQVIGHISRPDDCKWSAISVEMFPQLIELVPDTVYHVIGETVEVRKQFRALGVEDHVRYLPMATCDADIYAFYNGIDLLAHGSVMGETFGCTIAEAMAAGKPVVSHENLYGADNAQCEVIEHCVTGFMASSASTYAQYAAYLLKRPEVAAKWGQNGREKVAACFDAPLVTRGLEEIIRYFYTKKVAL